MTEGVSRDTRLTLDHSLDPATKPTARSRIPHASFHADRKGAIARRRALHILPSRRFPCHTGIPTLRAGFSSTRDARQRNESQGPYGYYAAHDDKAPPWADCGRILPYRNWRRGSFTVPSQKLLCSITLPAYCTHREGLCPST
jgi:hypothetical protein